MPEGKVAQITNPMEYMKESVIQLDNRVADIEQKVCKIDYILKNQNSGIRQQVIDEKESWINQFNI